MKKLILFVILYSLSYQAAYSQCANIDSLQRLLYVFRSVDTNRINTINSLAEAFIQNKQYGYAINRAWEAYRLSESIKYEIGKGDAFMAMGKIYFKDDLKKDKEAIESYLKALEIYENNGDKKRMASALKTIGTYYYDLYYLKKENYQLALDYYLRYLAISNEIGNKVQAAEANVLIGSLYDVLGESQKSQDYILKAIDLKKELEDEDFADPHLFSNAERIYTLQIENQRWFNYSLFGVVCLLVIVIFLLYINNSIKRKANLMLKASRDEIKKQKDSIEKKNKELYIQKEEIEHNRDQLAEQNQQIKEAQDEVRAANENLRRVNQQLEVIVESRTQDLVNSNEALVLANEELDTLIYRASHDFKGPVATVTGLSQLARIECKDNTIAVDFFEKIETTAQKMDGMLLKLHQVSYLIGKELSYKPIALDQLLQEVKTTLSDPIEKHQVSIETDIEPGLYFYSDHELLAIIFENLIENSINFRSQNPERTPVIKINAKNTVGYIDIEVTDNGVGVTREYFDKVFDMFFRGAENSKGNGLGLYVVKKAIERLDAEVEIDSQEGEFTTFLMHLPK